jgi:hypothetical protein
MKTVAEIMIERVVCEMDCFVSALLSGVLEAE